MSKYKNFISLLSLFIIFSFKGYLWEQKSQEWKCDHVEIGHQLGECYYSLMTWLGCRHGDVDKYRGKKTFSRYSTYWLIFSSQHMSQRLTQSNFLINSVKWKSKFDVENRGKRRNMKGFLGFLLDLCVGICVIIKERPKAVYVSRGGKSILGLSLKYS